MGKKRIAFVNQRYGEEVLGGSETYARKMAEALAEEGTFDVDVLTSKAVDFVTWEDYYEKDEEVVNGVTLRRFSIKSKRNRLVQRSSQILMHNFGLHPRELEEKRLIARGPYLPSMIDYIIENKDKYDAFVFVTYMYYPAYFGAKEVYEKAFFVPTAHDEEPIYMNIFFDLFNKVKGIVYLTEEEKKFVNGHFENDAVPSRIIGMGIEIPEEDKSEELREKKGLPENYIIYCGRIEESKGCKMLAEFIQKYNEENEDKVGLVLTGRGNMRIPEDENIKYLGFVSEEDKFAAMKGAKAICLPSEFESFSITLLEGMGCGKPALVNAKSEVLNAHMEKSGAGFAFNDYEEFKDSLKKILDEKTNKELGKKAAQYVNGKYSKEAVVKEFKEFILENI